MSEQSPTIQQVYDRLMALSQQPEEMTIGEVIEFIELSAAFLGWPCIDSDRAEDNLIMTFKRGGL